MAARVRSIACAALVALAACSTRAAPEDAGPRDTGPGRSHLPHGEWRVELDVPERGTAPSMVLVVGTEGGSFRWHGRSLLAGMTELHAGTFTPSRSDLTVVWREMKAAGFFEARDGARDPEGRCDSISYRGPDRATARCIDASPDAETLRRIASTVQAVVRRHEEDFDRPTRLPDGADRCETDADCVVDVPIQRCCPQCAVAMTKGLRSWHAALRRRCEPGVVRCPDFRCARPPGSARCDPHAKVCIAQ